MKRTVAKITIFSLILVFSIVQVFASNNMIDFQSLFNSHQSIMLIIRVDSGEIIFANDAAVKFYGYPNITSMSIDQINTLSPEEIYNERQLAFREERNFFKFKHRLSDGTIKDVEVRAYPFIVGDVSYLYSIILDRTSTVALETRKQILNLIIILALIIIALGSFFWVYKSRKNNRIILDKNKRISNIIAAANVGTWEWNYKNHDFEINERWAEMVGYTLNELKPMTIQKWKHFILLEDLQNNIAEINRLVNKDIKFHDLEFRMKHKDGSYIWVRSYGKVIEWDKDNFPLIIAGTHTEITDKKQYEQSLIHSEQDKSMIISSLPGVSYRCRYDENWTMIYMSNKCFDLTGYTQDELIENKEISFNDIIVPSYREYLVEQWMNAFNEERLCNIEYQITKKDGSKAWIWEQGKIFERKGEHFIEGFLMDISEIKHQEQALNQSMERYEEIAKQSRTFTWETNREGRITYISKVIYEVLEYTTEEIINKYYLKDLLHKDSLALINEIQGTLQPYSGLEKKLVSKSGKKVWVLSNGIPIIDDEGNLIGQRGSDTDITKDKVASEQVNYLQYHDQLTGLYNRFCYLKTILELDQKKKYPIVTTIFDIDGLKLINDAFGYEAGNQALIMVAERLKIFCKEDGILYRIGGDEFAIIQYNALNETLDKKNLPIEMISNNLSIKGVDLILSYGRAQKLEDNKPIEKIVQEAENEMYKMKSLQNRSIRSNAVMSILKTLTNKYREEEKHSFRVSEYCRLMAIELNYSSNHVTEIQYAGLLHDIGKISIPDEIIRKPGKLNDEEWEVMKTHSVVGYEILTTADQYSNIALYAKYHHERMDGRGYPEGLVGSQIPEQSRIIAIVDAFEAMTSDRVYRKALTQETAIKELRKYANTQFDAKLLEVFINNVLLRES